METAPHIPGSHARRISQLVEAMPDDLAREVVHYAEYLVARTKADDAQWDAAFAATPDDKLQHFIDAAMATETSDILDTGDTLEPVAAA